MSFFSNIRQVSEYLPVQTDPGLSFEPVYHQVAQAYGRWPVLLNEDGYTTRLFEWGLIADYMNSPEKIAEYRSSMANARSEKILDDKRSVWHRLRRQRCLVLTTGFFEHRDIGGKKKLPYFIKVKGETVFALAGLYNYAPLPDPETGEARGTFAVVTRPANNLLARIHNSGPRAERMPLILTRELAAQWLNPELDDTGIRQLLDFCFPDEELEAWPVPTIRTRKPNDRSVIEPLDASLFPPL